MATRVPLRALDTNSTPQRVPAGSVTKRHVATPGSAARPLTNSALSGGAKRVKVATPVSADTPGHTVTPKKTSTQAQPTTREVAKEREPHTPGYLQGTKSIKSVPLHNTPRPTPNKPPTGSAKKTPSAVGKAPTAAPHTAPSACKAHEPAEAPSPRSSQVNRALFHHPDKAASTPQRKTSTSTSRLALGPNVKAVVDSHNSPTRKPTLAGPPSSAGKRTPSKTQYSIDGRVRSKSTGSALSAQKAARPATLNTASAVKPIRSDKPMAAGARSPLPTGKKKTTTPTAPKTIPKAKIDINEALKSEGNKHDVKIQCSPIVSTRVTARAMSPEVPTITEQDDDTMSMVSVSSSILRGGINSILVGDSQSEDLAKKSAFVLPTVRCRATSGSTEASTAQPDDRSIGGCSLDSKGQPKLRPVVQLVPMKRRHLAPNRKAPSFSPIHFQYEQPSFDANLTTIAELSNGNHSLLDTSGLNTAGNSNALAADGNNSSAVLDDSGECISTIAPTPNTATGVMPFLDESISVCPSTTQRLDSASNASCEPASEAIEEVDGPPGVETADFGEYESGEYIVNDDMTVTSDLTNFTADFTSLMDTSLTAPAPPMTRLRASTTTSVPSYFDGGRPPAISVSAANRREFLSVGNSVNFDGISPLASNTPIHGGATPIHFTNSTHGFNKGGRLSQSMSSINAPAPLMRVNSVGSTADASFAVSESSQPGDLLNTAMRMSDQSALNLMRSLLSNSPIPASALPSPMSLTSVGMPSKARLLPGRSPSPLLAPDAVIHEEELNPLNASTTSTASSDSCLSNAVPPIRSDAPAAVAASRGNYPPLYSARPISAQRMGSRNLHVDSSTTGINVPEAMPMTPPPHQFRDTDPVARAFMLYQSPARGSTDSCQQNHA